MNQKDMLKRYFKKRKQSLLYCGIEETGIRLSIKIDNMEKAKLLKPSEYEVDDMINTCKDMKEHLLKLLEELYNNNIKAVSEDEANNFRAISITKLNDCKLIADSYKKVGNNLREKYVNPLMSIVSYGTPIQFTFAEGFIICSIIFMCIWITSILH